MKNPIFLGLSLAVFTSLVQAAPIPINGVARNITTSKPLPGASVRLVQPNDKGQREVIDTATTDANGRFAFAPRDFGKAQVLMTEVTHGGMDYWRLAYDGGNVLKTKMGLKIDPKNVDLQVFDTTTKAIPLDFQVHHLAVETSENGLKCVERIVVQNATKTTLLGVGPNRVTVMLDLPKSAKNVRLDPKIIDAKLVKTSSGWGVSRLMMPDSYMPMGAQVQTPNALIINYDIDWPSQMPWAKRVDLSRKIMYPTKFFFIARKTDDKGLQIAAPKLLADQEAELPIDDATEKRIVNAVGRPMGDKPVLQPNQNLTMAISKPVNPLFWGFSGLTVALCLFLPVAMMKPRRRAASKTRERSEHGSVSEPTSLPAQNAHVGAPLLNGFATDISLDEHSRNLVSRIADLDDQREAGRVDEAEYRAQRARWKKELIDSLALPPDSH